MTLYYYYNVRLGHSQPRTKYKAHIIQNILKYIIEM